MDVYLQALWLRVRDGAHVCWAAAFPSDRPSGLFAVYTSVLNGGLLVWSFAVVLGSSCSRDATIWISLGMAHCYINMIFGVASMMQIRRRIACGIPEEMSQWRVFYTSPLMLLYAFYLVCELVWMIAAAQLSVRTTAASCAQHITVQILFLVFHWIGGLLVIFQVTFATERWRRPRWRTFAAMRWEFLHNAQRQRSVRWHDEHGGEAGDEAVDVDQVEGRRHGRDTERTTAMDYASVLDDATTLSEQQRERRNTAVAQRSRAGI